MLESIEPSIVDFTTTYSWLLRKLTVIIISTALPKVALSKPLSMSLLSVMASSSVASPNILASGIMAQKFNQNVQDGLPPRYGDRMPQGTHRRRREMGLMRMFFKPWMLLLLWLLRFLLLVLGVSTSKLL